MPRPLLVLIALALVLAHPARAQTATLKVGDRAPALTVGKWLKGGPLSGFDSGKVYVVELCSTWSPTLRESVPFLNVLQARFADKGVTVVGVSLRESSRTAPETFVAKAPGPIDYAFATDDVPAPPQGTPDDRVWAVENGRMSGAWLKASGRNTVPTALIVDREGRVAWIGNTLYPRGELEDALTQVLAGTLTPETSIALSEGYRVREQKEKEADAKFRRALADRNARAAVAALDELIALDGAFWMPAVAARKFQIMLTEVGDPKGACAFAASALEGPLKEHAQPLNDIAWILMDTRGLPETDRDLDLALRLAARADDLMKHQRPDVMDTLARAHYERRDLDTAVALQREAVELQRRIAESAQDKERATRLLQELEATLKRYQEQKDKPGGG